MHLRRRKRNTLFYAKNQIIVTSRLAEREVKAQLLANERREVAGLNADFICGEEKDYDLRGAVWFDGSAFLNRAVYESPYFVWTHKEKTWPFIRLGKPIFYWWVGSPMIDSSYCVTWVGSVDMQSLLGWG